MIVVTRLAGPQFAVNPDLIERIFESPDTTLVMADGARFIVTETMVEVIEKIVAFRAKVIALAYDGHDEETTEMAEPAPPHLSIIHPAGPTGGTNTGRQ